MEEYSEVFYYKCIDVEIGKEPDWFWISLAVFSGFTAYDKSN